MNAHTLRFVCTAAAVVLAFVAIGSTYANTVTTPCGAQVPHSHPTPDWTPAEKAAWQTYIEQNYPNVVVKGEATKSYNCHSYCWAGHAEWINDPGVYIDSYEFDAPNGGRLTYLHCLTNGPSHSAVDTGPYEATSKWGQLCLVEHDWDDVPASYGDVEAMYSGRDCACGAGDCDW